MSSTRLLLGGLLMMIVTGMCTASFVGDISPQREAKARLYEDLAAHRVLNSKINPLSQEGVVEVDFGLWINKVSEVVEAKQTMKAHVYLSMIWRDKNLAWNEEDYANISFATIPGHLIWRPTIYQSTSAENDWNRLNEPLYVRLLSDGTVMSRTADFVTTHCNFDLTYYPLDTQTCGVQIAYEGMDVPVQARSLSLMNPDPNASAVFFDYEGEWRVESRDVFSHPPLAFFGAVEISVTIRRATLYYILCVLLPMIATSMLTLLVFWIPPGSGEKISYLVSIYVSTALFLNFVGDTLPRNMSRTNTPRMTLFLVFVIMECVLALAVTVLVMRTHQQEQEAANEPSTKTRGGGLGDKPSGQSVGTGQSGTGVCCGVLTCGLTKVHSMEGEGLGKRKMSAAARLDRLFFCVFFLACVTFYTLVFLI